MPRPVCWSKARGTRRELRPIPMGEAEIDSLLFRQKRYLTCLLSSLYAKNAKKKEVEGLTVTSGQWPVKPAPPIIIIMHRDGVILCKAGLRSPAVWGLVSKASSTTSRKLLRSSTCQSRFIAQNRDSLQCVLAMVCQGFPCSSCSLAMLCFAFLVTYMAASAALRRSSLVAPSSG